MKILFNGDSNMAGTEVGENESIPYYLHQLIDSTASTTNLAFPGASNDYIYNTTVEHIKGNNPDLVIIGWSDPGRVQWYDTDENQLVEMNWLGVTGTPRTEQHEQAIQTLADLMGPSSEYPQYLSLYWHIRIQNLHRMLSSKNIPHLFFNAFELFLALKNKPEHQVDWGHSYISPYNGSYTQWCTDQGYEEVTPGFLHFKAPGQRAWAEKLYSHMAEHDLIR